MKEEKELIIIHESMALTVRTYLSDTFIRSACNFAKQSRELEEKYIKTGTIQNEDIVNHKGFIASTIILCAAFLESTINEFYLDVYDNQSCVKELGEKSTELIKFYLDIDKPSIEKIFSILEKYTFALLLCNKEPFTKSSSPYQDINSLVFLRNALTHYKLKPHTTGKDIDYEVSKIESKLKGRFDLNPFLTGPANAFFPDRCLSYGCAKWAIESSITFTDTFFRNMGLLIPYEYYRRNFKLDE